MIIQGIAYNLAHNKQPTKNNTMKQYKVITTVCAPIIVRASSRYDAIRMARIELGYKRLTLKGFTKEVVSCKQY